MNNHRDILGLAVNIIVVAVILCLIVAGLNRIGIYDLPDGLEKLLGTYEENLSDTPTSVDDVTDSINYDTANDMYVSSVDLDLESARELLGKIVPATDYSHILSIEKFLADGSSYKHNISAVCENGLYEATVFDSESTPIKRIFEKQDTVEIEYASSDEENKIVLPRGGFNISDECGYILTVENFLNSGYELDEASFSASNGAYGAQIKITFDTVLDSYTQKETYVVSLDYGIVLSAECYENDMLVFTMKTKSLVMN